MCTTEFIIYLLRHLLNNFKRSRICVALSEDAWNISWNVYIIHACGRQVMKLRASCAASSKNCFVLSTGNVSEWGKRSDFWKEKKKNTLELCTCHHRGRPLSPTRNPGAPLARGGVSRVGGLALCCHVTVITWRSGALGLYTESA